MVIYVPLLNEGTDCWRPVEAETVGPDLFRILASKPDDQEWPVHSGDIVQCKLHRFADGSEGLAAVLSGRQ